MEAETMDGITNGLGGTILHYIWLSPTNFEEGDFQGLLLYNDFSCSASIQTLVVEAKRLNASSDLSYLKLGHPRGKRETSHA
jgi:hypothetical protein